MYSNSIEKLLIVNPRHDTLENWLKNNPILRNHELCCVITKFGKCKYKIGDGKTPFKKLRYTNKLSDIENIIIYNGEITVSSGQRAKKFLRTTEIRLDQSKY